MTRRRASRSPDGAMELQTQRHSRATSPRFRDVIGSIFSEDRSDFGLIALGMDGCFGVDLRGIGEVDQESKIKANWRLQIRFCLHIVFSPHRFFREVRLSALHFFFNAMMRAGRI